MGAKGVIMERGQHGVRMFHRVYCRVQMQRGNNKNPNTSLTRAWDTWGVSALVTGGSTGRERDAPTGGGSPQCDASKEDGGEGAEARRPPRRLWRWSQKEGT